MAYKEATIADLQEGDLSANDVTVLCWMDSIVLKMILLTVQNLEVVTEIGGATLFAYRGGTGNFFLNM